ncbi:hypothetical protein [Campylobacter fetus]|uniref:hypothetical protein n=1 Tax=Campylobacter fetus TaxID=196 RepID=UPI0026DEADD5|nr:hypothetical protein [Campylobacter fetus]
MKSVAFFIKFTQIKLNSICLKRFCVSIYKAIEDGLDFDLETMRDLFDTDTWASAYECQFVDDESSLLSISLIKSCVDNKAHYFTPKK